MPIDYNTGLRKFDHIHPYLFLEIEKFQQSLSLAISAASLILYLRPRTEFWFLHYQIKLHLL